MIFHLKSLKILNIDPILIDIIHQVYETFGLSVITSAYRPKDKGVHGTNPLRGIDLRCSDAMIGAHISNWINQRWQYDHNRPQKKVATFHNIGQGNHLHFQVHPQTKRIGIGRW